MKINSVCKSYHLLFKQIAFESPQKFCLDETTGLTPPVSSGSALALWAWPLSICQHCLLQEFSAKRDILILQGDWKPHCCYHLFWSSSIRHYCCFLSSKSTSLRFTSQWRAMHIFCTCTALPISCLLPTRRKRKHCGVHGEISFSNCFNIHWSQQKVSIDLSALWFFILQHNSVTGSVRKRLLVFLKTQKRLRCYQWFVRLAYLVISYAVCYLQIKARLQNFVSHPPLTLIGFM